MELFIAAGAYIKRARKAAGKTQSQVGAEIGITQSHFSKLELGAHECPHGMLNNLCEAICADKSVLAALYDKGSRSSEEARLFQDGCVLGLCRRISEIKGLARLSARTFLRIAEAESALGIELTKEQILQAK